MGDLSHLSYDLCIEKLQYVVNEEEASQARMIDKEYFENLKLFWEKR